MKKNSGKQAVINYVGQHPGCSFQDIRRVDWPPESPDSWYHLS